MRDYEEARLVGALWGWVLIVVLCLILVGWGLFSYAVVRDAPRQWDYGALPEPPAASVYTTSGPSAGAPQRQIAPLPNAQPWPGLQAPPPQEVKP